MVSSESTCSRILAALEDLVEQESAVVHVGDYEALDRIQSQTEPLITFLAANASAAFAAGLQNRILALRATRHRTATKLSHDMTRNRDELRLVSGRQGLIARVAPAYGSNAGGSRQLSLVG